MSTSVIPFDKSKLQTALVHTSHEAAPSTTFLRLSKTGEWTVGAEGEEVPEGTLFAVNPNGFQHGYICWGEGARLGEKILPVTEPLPEPGPVPAGGRGWEFQLGCQMKALDGDLAGTEVIYRASSVGGKKAIALLTGLVAKKLGEDTDAFVPVVSLGTDSYKHAAYGRIITPVLKIVRWMKMPAPGDVAAEPKKAAPKKLAKPKKK